MSAAEALEKRILYTEDGTPSEVMIPYEKFIDFIETYGLDLTEDEQSAIREARFDIDSGNLDAFVSADEARRQVGCTD